MENFDKSIQKTQEWIKGVMSNLEIENSHKAFELLKGILLTLRDRLPMELAVKLGAQLPVLLRGFYYEGWKPIQTPIKMKDKEDFIEVLKMHNRGFEMGTFGNEENWDEVIKGVFDVLKSHISEGEIQKLMDVLPKPFMDWLKPS